MAAWRPALWPSDALQGGWRFRVVVALVLGVLLIGQLFSRGYLLPSGDAQPIARMINQLLIFSPIFVAAAFAARKGSGYARRVAFLPTDAIWIRLAVGVLAAGFALLAFYGVQGRLLQIPDAVARIVSPALLSHSVQILGEDLGIGMLLAAALVRFRAWVAVATIE